MPSDSLSSLLTAPQRQSLLNLLHSATSTQRANLLQIFPSSELPPDSPVAVLKSRALDSFNSWRDALLARFNEAVPTDTKSSLLHSSPPHPDAPLSELPVESKKKIFAALLLMMLSLHTYDARSRVLLGDLAHALSLPAESLAELERTTAAGLLEAAQLADAKGGKKDGGGKWQIPLATAAGAALIGVTGGLAAPLVAAGISSVLGGLGLGATAMATYLGAAAGSSALVGTLFGAYGARRTNEIATRYASEVEDFALLKLSDDSRLRVAVGVTGWIEGNNAGAEFTAPWKAWDQERVAAYALRWETGVLEDLGHGAGNLLSDYAVGWVKKQIISRTIFATLSAALWPVGLLKAAKVVDNPFSLAMRRSKKAGVVLAEVLLSRAAGERPVTLAGFSMGARVVYECCRELSRRGGFGLVENVVIMGAPVPAEEEGWREVRAVVAGKMVNVWSAQDWVLGFLYRTADLRFGVAGLQEVEVHGVENVDVGERVSGHLRYRWEVPFILREVLGEDVKFEDGDMPRPETVEARQTEGPENEKEFEERVDKVEQEMKDKQLKREQEKGKGDKLEEKAESTNSAS